MLIRFFLEGTSIKKHGDKLKLGQRIAASDLVGFDEVVLATGIVPRALDIPDLDHPKRDGTLCQVGLPPAPLPVNVFALTGRRRRLAGSFIGGIAETQEMLEFCAQHGIVSDIELIPIQEINAAYERLARGGKYRFVIDMASLAADPEA